MGGVVYWVNADYGFWQAIPAALKQATYTAIAGGFLTRICERMTRRFDGVTISLILGMMVPSTIAVILTYGVHMLKGTPEPFNSTIPTMVLAPISFLYWSWRVKRRQEKATDMVEFAQQQQTDPTAH